MTTSFNKQQFEDKIYEVVTSEVNNFFKKGDYNQSDALKTQRQMLQALHFIAEETISQIVWGMLIMMNVNKKDRDE